MRVAQVVGTRNISQPQSLRVAQKLPVGQTVYASPGREAKQFTDFTALK